MLAFSSLRTNRIVLFAFALATAGSGAEAVETRTEALPPHAVARIGTARLRHGDTVTVAVFAPDGKTAATGEREGVLSLWDAESGQERVRYRGHRGAVLSASFPVGGERLISGGSDGTARIWRVPREEPVGKVAIGQELRCIRVLREEVQAFALSADGSTAAAGTANGLVVVYDLKRGRERQRLDAEGPIFCLALSVDGKLAAVNRGASGLQLWEVGQRAARWHSDHGVVASLAFAPDGLTLAAGYQNNRLVLWDARRGTEVRALEGHERALPGQPQGVVSLCFSADGRRLLSGGADGSARIWDVETGGRKHTLEGHRACVTATAFAPDGKHALSGSSDNTARLWDTATGRSSHTEIEPASPSIGLALAPDGRTLVTLHAPDCLKLWDASNGRERPIPAGVGNRASAAAFRPLGHTLAVAGTDERLRFWDLAARTVRVVESETPRRLQRLVWSHDGKRLLSTGPDHHLDLWDADKRELIRRMGLQDEAYLALAFDRRDQGVAAASEADAIRSWEIGSGSERATIHERFAGALALVYSPDGRSLYAAGCDGRVRLWELATRSSRWSFASTTEITAAAFTLDGLFLATGESDGTVHLWDVATGTERRVFRGHRGAIVALDFAVRTPLLASASRDTTAFVWDFADVLPQQPPSPLMLTERELETIWSDLAAAPTAAYDALQKLRRAPGQAMPYLRGRLQPVKLDSERLIADLDSEVFAKRQKASEDLAGFGRVVEKSLRHTLTMCPTLEVRKRILDLLDRMRDAPDSIPAQPRQIRCVELLESIGDAEARRLLRVLAGGIDEAELTHQAKASLERLARRPLPRP